MTPVRPKSVSPEATLIYPGQNFGPGFGVQQATLTAISTQIARQNANLNLHYANAMRDWTANAEIDKYLGLPDLPAPPKPHLITLKITYADINGTVTNDQTSEDGNHYAWLEQTVA